MEEEQNQEQKPDSSGAVDKTTKFTVFMMRLELAVVNCCLEAAKKAQEGMLSAADEESAVWLHLECFKHAAERVEKLGARLQQVVLVTSVISDSDDVRKLKEEVDQAHAVFTKMATDCSEWLIAWAKAHPDSPNAQRVIKLAEDNCDCEACTERRAIAATAEAQPEVSRVEA